MITLVHVQMPEGQRTNRLTCRVCGYFHKEPREANHAWILTPEEMEYEIQYRKFTYQGETYSCTDPLAQVAFIHTQ